jgi:anti-sigma factor RsiW
VPPKELSCREIVELVSEYLDDALAGDERDAFERHVAECEGCQNYLTQMRDTIRLTGELREESLSPALREDLLAAFRGWSGRS